MEKRVLLLVCLLAACGALAKPEPKEAVFRKVAERAWKAYTADQPVQTVDGQRTGWIRRVITYAPKAVQYTVNGDMGTVSAPVRMATSPPKPSADLAKNTDLHPHDSPAMLTMSFAWRGGGWQLDTVKLRYNDTPPPPSPSSRVAPRKGDRAEAQILSAGQPEVPSWLAREGGRYQVVVRFTVTAKGKIRDATVVKSDDTRLNPYCIAAAKKIKARSAILNGEPRDTTATWTYNFVSE